MGSFPKKSQRFQYTFKNLYHRPMCRRCLEGPYIEHLILFSQINRRAEVSHRTIKSWLKLQLSLWSGRPSDSRIDLLYLFPDCRGQRWGGKDSEGSRWGIMCNSPLMGSTAWEFLKRADSCRMREEADYPPSFCVWDQDQRVNPPLDEESRARGEDRQVGVRRATTISQKRKKEEEVQWEQEAVWVCNWFTSRPGRYHAIKLSLVCVCPNWRARLCACDYIAI